MDERREAKKSETLEVRLSHEVKHALMQKAQAEGRSASEVVRHSISAYLAEQPKEARSMLITAWKPAAAVAAGTFALIWSVVAPNPALAGPDLRAAFVKFDADQDGSVSLDEFRAGHSDDRFMVHSNMPRDQVGPVMIPIHHGARPTDTAASPVPPEMLRAEFSRQDVNGNGSVDFAEFEAFHVGMMKTAFGNLDADKDGAIDQRELRAIAGRLPKGAPHPEFAELDSDGNGKLSEEEFFHHD